MMSVWDLPTSTEIGGETYTFNADFRDVLEIIRILNNTEDPEYVRWSVSIALFYNEPIPQNNLADAIRYLAEFLNCGKLDPDDRPRPRLMDWEHDADAIIAGVNKVAAQEIRALPFVHWWTFIAWFHAIGEGTLSTVVSIRDKLRRGKKLEKWEAEFYKDNRRLVDLPRPEYTEAENAVLQQWV